MAYNIGKEIDDSLLPDALFTDSNLLNGVARYLQDTYRVSVKPSELFHDGRRLLHRNRAVEMPLEIAYKMGVEGRIKELQDSVRNYLEENRNSLPPAIVFYKINDQKLGPVPNRSIVNLSYLPPNLTELEKLEGELKHLQPGYTLRYEAEGNSIGNARIVERTLTVVPLRDFMRLLTREETNKFIKDPLYDNFTPGERDG